MKPENLRCLRAPPPPPLPRRHPRRACAAGSSLSFTMAQFHTVETSNSALVFSRPGESPLPSPPSHSPTLMPSTPHAPFLSPRPAVASPPVLLTCNGRGQHVAPPPSVHPPFPHCPILCVLDPFSPIQKC
ncbi:hypothetical protein E2C01_031815 [Portunus trituberculatus]|uniref:Uncharacterized protein n=1 Tax=Portunus trituberculatus TaxID=210409 RepID=A0A5B7ETT5_PORTR|nr:hypothetical protein [Portunus trituberculatus]